MNRREQEKVLAVVRDTAVLEALVDAATATFNAQITCVARGKDALDIDRVDSHHLVLTEHALPDMSGFELAGTLLAVRRRPLILIGGEPSVDELLRAMRLGVSDYLPAPVDTDHLRLTVMKCLHGAALERRRNHRERKLRSLLRRVLSDRRNLNQRMDLLCRDMVGAHRRLLHRVLADEEARDS